MEDRKNKRRAGQAQNFGIQVPRCVQSTEGKDECIGQTALTQLAAWNPPGRSIHQEGIGETRKSIRGWFTARRKAGAMVNDDVFEPRALEAIRLAANTPTEANITSGHLLLAAIKVGPQTRAILDSWGITADSVESRLPNIAEDGPPGDFSTPVRDVLLEAKSTDLNDGRRKIGLRDLVGALITTHGSEVASIIEPSTGVQLLRELRLKPVLAWDALEKRYQWWPRSYSRAFSANPPAGKLTACKSNMTNIGTACQMYAADNAGLYPGSLGLLTPNYLKTIPTYPAARDRPR